jgi:DNA-binding MarR family transcriptional regulator
VPDEPSDRLDSVAAWAKKYYLTSRTLIESVLREHDLGPTQWYVLHQLVNVGPTMQRDLSVILKIERATLSGVVTTLTRKGLVLQTPDAVDQRQRLLSITEQGRRLWTELPDPVDYAYRIAFEGADEADMAIARALLKRATQQLTDHIEGAGPSLRAKESQRGAGRCRGERILDDDSATTTAPAGAMRAAHPGRTGRRCGGRSDRSARLRCPSPGCTRPLPRAARAAPA